ncbi:hypothetical protein Syun_004384 [Stephania yunnanensis]|uniref:Amidase domain-containing protein n=1 Tax=Stephania yunnanensis TaxID=152371 RepID=A0AAP0L2Y3_9MAGN
MRGIPAPSERGPTRDKNYLPHLQPYVPCYASPDACARHIGRCRHTHVVWTVNCEEIIYQPGLGDDSNSGTLSGLSPCSQHKKGRQHHNQPQGDTSIPTFPCLDAQQFTYIQNLMKSLALIISRSDFYKYEEEVDPIDVASSKRVALRAFVWLIELPLVGSLVTSFFKRKNGITRELQETLVPEAPMFRPEFPPQEPEPGTLYLEEESAPLTRVESALKCLPPYNPANSWNCETSPFLYWKIRDFAHAYRSGFSTPSAVAECIISELEEFNNKNPTMPFLISFHTDDMRNQAAASTQRFKEGRPLSILDGVFMCVKDDIDCYPHPTKGATTWFHKVRPVEEDAICVSRLRSCGVIFVGKANMHELGLGVSGNNPNYGTARNPHALERYTGGSSSGPAALVAAGLCSAAVGTDGGGSIRIPSSLCGTVGLKTTYGRTNMEGSLVDGGTMEIIGPLAATVEDVMLVYAAMLGSSPADKFNLKPPPPGLPMLSSGNGLDDFGSLRLGKYTEWFNDVYSTDISDKCDDVLNLLQKTCACQITEIVIPELHEMKTSHMVVIGSETLYSMNPYCLDESGNQITHDTRASLAFFRSFSASDYVGAACLRCLHCRIEFLNLSICRLDLSPWVLISISENRAIPIFPQSPRAKNTTLDHFIKIREFTHSG